MRIHSELQGKRSACRRHGRRCGRTRCCRCLCFFATALRFWCTSRRLSRRRRRSGFASCCRRFSFLAFAMFCRRLARSRRLSLHAASAGKCDCKEERKESFSHGSERKQPAGLRSTHFQWQPIFGGKKTGSLCLCTPHCQEKAMPRPSHADLTPKAFVS